MRAKWNIDLAPESTKAEAGLLSMNSEISHPILCCISEKCRLGTSVASPLAEWLLFYVFRPPALSCLLTTRARTSRRPRISSSSAISRVDVPSGGHDLFSVLCVV
jgi:hypothetical protein